MHRISFFVTLVSGLIVLIAVGHLAGTTAQEGTPVANQGFAGSWRVSVAPEQGPPLATLSTYGADGTVVSSALPAQQPPPGAPTGLIFASAAHGAWQATGVDTANVTFVELRADEHGQPLGTLSVHATITLDADGQTFGGAFVTSIADPDGNELASFSGTVQARRIVAEPPPATPGT